MTHVLIMSPLAMVTKWRTGASPNCTNDSLKTLLGKDSFRSCLSCKLRDHKQRIRRCVKAQLAVLQMKHARTAFGLLRLISAVWNPVRANRFVGAVAVVTWQ